MKEMEILWKEKHPFKPNISPSPTPKNNVSYDSMNSRNLKTSLILERHIKNNYDTNTLQPLYTPKINE